MSEVKKVPKGMTILEKAWFYIRHPVAAARYRRNSTVRDFAQRHRDFLVIVLDPKDDSLYASYRGKEVFNVIKAVDGSRQRVVKKVLARSTFKGNIDKLISSVAQAFDLSLKNGNLFYHWLDGALHAISQALWLKKRDKAA